MSAILSPGHVFHRRYEVVRCLKSGGMGAIYEVVHLETRRRRALKVMLPSIVANRDMHARFRLEATVAAEIESEHIVETFDAGVDEDTGAPFLVMELLRGEDLGSMLGRRGALPVAEVVTLLSQVAGALGRTHAAGVVHRDLKPDNLFVARRDDGTPKIKILDFGIAKVVAESGEVAARTKILGTPLYMSPEQIRGDGAVGHRADLYAVGHIAFTLLVGRAYWSEQAKQDEVYALMLKIASGGGPTATEMAARRGVTLPAAFDAWFAHATASDPRRRFASAPDLVEALAAVLSVPWARAPAPLPERSSPDLSFGAAQPTPVTSLLPDSLLVPVPSMTTLGAATVTGPRPSQSVPDPAGASLPPAGATGAARAPRSRRRVGALVLAVITATVAGGIAARLSLWRPLPSPVVSRATAAATLSAVVIEPPPAPPAVTPVVTPIPDDAGSPVPMGETPEEAPPAAAPRPLAPKPRPARPIPVLIDRPVPTAPPAPAVPDESVLLPRK